MTATYRGVRRLAVVVAVALLAPLLVAVAGPASPAAAVTPAPIPDGLWDVTPAVGAGVSYLALDGVPGDPAIGGNDYLYTKADSGLTVSLSENLIKFEVDAGPAAFWRGVLGVGPDPVPPGVGYYVDAGAGFPDIDLDPPFVSCGDSPGWFTVDSIALTAGALTQVTIRWGQSCNGGPESHGKLSWFAADTTEPPGPQPVPGGLWDAPLPVPAGSSFAYLEGGRDGGTLFGGRALTYAKTDSVLRIEDQGRKLSVVIDGPQFWQGEFLPMSSIDRIEPGFYAGIGNAWAMNPAKGAMIWHGEGEACTPVDGWLAVDTITRTAGAVTELSLRFEVTCNVGLPKIRGKIVWYATDKSVPAPENPIPPGLWDVVPTGASGNYFYVDGAVDDPLTGGVDTLVLGAEHPFGASDADGGIRLLVGVGQQDFWVGWFDGVNALGYVEPGYYGSLSSSTSSASWLGGIEVNHALASAWTCTAGSTTGWFAIDHLGRIDGQLSRLDLRFEQSCGGAPPAHGRVHIDLGGLDVGPPLGAFESAVPVTGGVKVDGWALDPETASPIDVDVLVDGVVTTTINASGNRPDVGTANPLYGNGHGFSANVSVPLGTHQVCARARNTGVGADATIGCKTVKVGSGSPFGSFDVAYAGPQSVNVAGWAIDPDTSLPIPVHVYVDSTGVALTADGARPDVGSAFPGLGDAHGFSSRITTTPGTHNVCAYAINSGAGATTGLGCKTVTVLSGPPIGSLDVASLVPGVGVKVGGWALDPDTAASIAVHVYVDGKGVALTADGNRSDIGAIFPGYGPAHGFSGTIPAGPGQHTVCAYAINTGAGSTSTLGCKVVNVPTGSPIGSLDLVSGGKGYVSAGGWAADPDTAAPIAVHLYVDSAGTAVNANLNRSDVGAYFPPWGPLHGWATTVNATPGLHKVCAYAINVGAGSTTLLGCRLVVVT